MKCPRCKNDASFGILSVGGDILSRRCKDCRYSHNEHLPALNKKVVYLDQFAVSELYKTKAKTRKPGAPHESFWGDCLRIANTAYLRQQVIFPASNLHSDETIVFHSPGDLRLAHEMLSGETSFESSDDIAAKHEQVFAKAYLLKAGVPVITFDVDDILDGERNAWIPKFHIGVNANFSMFAPGIRNDKSVAETSLKGLADRWATDKPTFDTVLEHELASYGPATKQALVHALTQAQGDHVERPNELLDLRTGLINRYKGLEFLFERHGVSADASSSEVMKFLDWTGNQHQPIHRVFAYLFAALAWRISSGQRSEMKASILNDFTAIATYAPYVDAMFIDNQCASLLQQGHLKTELNYKAKIFSLNSRDDFLNYLTEIDNSTPTHVRRHADAIYSLS